MSDTVQPPQPSTSGEENSRRRFFRRAAIATVVAGLASGIGLKVFAQGGGHGGWYRGGFMGAPLDPATLDEHLDRMLKHLYVEIDATDAQKQQLAPLVKGAARELLPLRAKMHDARRQAVELLSGESIDRAALETLRADQLKLADTDGLELCRRLRAKSDTPVLMLTARGDAMDRVVGLEMGADDYLPKPFEPRELLARLRAILRRRQSGRASDVLRFGRLEIDRDARTVRVDGVERSLTGYQFTLLVALAEKAGRVLSRDTLMDLVRGEALEAFDRSIDVHVSRIRAAIEDDPKRPRRILTVRGAGYVFAKQQD